MSGAHAGHAIRRCVRAREPKGRLRDSSRISPPDTRRSTVSASCCMTAQRTGCIAAEVGIPFSDPLADGPTIQRTGQVALHNGMTLATGSRSGGRCARSDGVTIPLAADDVRQPGAQFRTSMSSRVRRHRRASTALSSRTFQSTRRPSVREAMHACRRRADPARGADDHGGTSGTHLRDGRRVRLLRRRHRGDRRTGDDLPTTRSRCSNSVRRLTPLPRALGFGLSTHEHLDGAARARRSGRGRVRAARQHRRRPGRCCGGCRSDSCNAMIGREPARPG